ncbi:TRADD-N-associated membrane domain-containing protein [Bacillus cereus]|uniref:TRADD-N-associated membrane domain-containing protein n=1 Tax=Bacillus cereus TaxID=1396 RepID=UPI000BEB463D|nr:hypothetical protein [Bacillus cereus]PED04630.1 hypothetical protein CON14_01725 [Bacillus cereus]PEY91919.1 hypothetical protein CN353_22370 [Bacillus cereus]PFU97589.1 hypothetical protein COL04_01705 [Bacillus cereus]
MIGGSNGIELISTIISFLAVIVSIFYSFSILRQRKQNSYKEQVKEFVDNLYLIDENTHKQLNIEHIQPKQTIEQYKQSSLNQEAEKKKIELAVHQTFMAMHQKQAIIHSRVQFYIGLLMSIVGFFLIIYVVYTALRVNNALISSISILGSLILEAISLLFLKESQKLRQSAKEYHDNLSESNRHQEAIKVSNSIEDLEIKAAIQAQMALHLIGVASDNVDITKIMTAKKDS